MVAQCDFLRTGTSQKARMMLILWNVFAFFMKILSQTYLILYWWAANKRQEMVIFRANILHCCDNFSALNFQTRNTLWDTSGTPLVNCIHFIQKYHSCIMKSCLKLLCNSRPSVSSGCFVSHFITLLHIFLKLKCISYFINKRKNKKAFKIILNDISFI